MWKIGMRLKSLLVAHSSVQRGSIMEKSWFMSMLGGMKVCANNDKCPLSHTHPSPNARWPEEELLSTSLHSPSPHPSTVWFSSELAPLHLHSTPHLPFINVFFRRQSFFPSLLWAHLLSLPCDLSAWRRWHCCPWWIPMIQRFRARGARQSPLSWSRAICLCQPSPHICNMGQTVKKRERRGKTKQPR